MDDYKNTEDRKSLLLEGMYNGVAGKIEEVRQSVQREIQYNSAQQVDAYDALAEEFRAGIGSVLAELRYVAQQSSAIYDYDNHERESMRDALMEAVRKQADELLAKLTEHVDKRIAEIAAGAPVAAESVVDEDAIAEKVAARLLEAQRAEEERRAQALAAEAVEAEAPVAEAVEEVAEVVEEVPAEEVAEIAEEVEVPAEEVVEAPAEAVAEGEEVAAEAVAEEAPAEEAEAAAEPAEAVAEEPEKRAPRAVTFDDETFDYELLAEKIAIAIPETDYDLIADKVVAALPQQDDILFAEHVAAALPQLDENLIADRVAESLPLTDYDLIAERVAAVLQETELKLTEETIERIAERVAEMLRGDEVDLERIARDTLAEEPEEAPEEVPEEAPAEEIAAAAVPAAEAETPEPPAEEPKKPARAKKEPAAPVAVAVPVPPEGMMTRYKRSFIAKIIESEDDVKEYYSEMKNALLAYQKAGSQVSWSNDRFTLKGETVAKIGIRGRTLCLYLALNPEEFPETVYHQKFAGDTKMYEKTPMMVKIKSGVALKRAIRLIELLMEKNGAVGENIPPVDYAAQYAFRSEEELLAEGLIKTAIVEKSDLDF